MQETKPGEEEQVPESSRFIIHFHPDAVVYRVDKDLIRALVHRGAFHGLHDGRERELGEASIIGFKLHHSNGETETVETRGHERLGEWDAGHVDAERDMLEQAREAAPLPVWFRLPTAYLVVSAAAVLVGLVAVRFALQWRGRRVDYEQLGVEATPICDNTA